jgi:hypothetical protein
VPLSFCGSLPSGRSGVLPWPHFFFGVYQCHLQIRQSIGLLLAQQSPIWQSQSYYTNQRSLSLHEILSLIVNLMTNQVIIFFLAK